MPPRSAPLHKTDAAPAVPPADAASRLAKAVEHAAHLLPARWPISVFIRHNTLHAFDHMAFDAAVRRGAEPFGTQPFLSEEKFRAALGSGRISHAHLEAGLANESGERAAEDVAPGVSWLSLRLGMLVHPQWTGTAAEERWKLAEERVTTRQATLWQSCLASATATPPPAVPPRYRRTRDVLLDGGWALTSAGAVLYTLAALVRAGCCRRRCGYPISLRTARSARRS